MEKVMSVNAGSSSIKFKLYDMPEEKVICSGICERIGMLKILSLNLLKRGAWDETNQRGKST